ncbi:hypothetical protein ACHQM5_015398 [Ranunculus cassubicifolius]
MAQGITFQHVIARNGVHMTSQDPLEEIQCRKPKWYFSKKEIEDNSPSRRDGIDFKKETWLRGLYCSLVLDLGMKLKVPQVTIATAMLFCHRFYLHQSHAKNDWQTIATVSVFLACKVEDTPRPLADVIVVAYELLYRRDPNAAKRIKQPDVYEKQKQLILIGERLLMTTIAFDFNYLHPYKPLVASLKKLDLTYNEVSKVAWNFVNDWFRTTLVLQYKPHYIAAGSLFLAAKYCKVKLPSERGKVWWLEFDVSPQQLEDVIKQMLRLLEENKKPDTAGSHKKVLKQSAVEKESSTSPESEITSVDTPRQSSDASTHKCDVVRNVVEGAQCQTSEDCGSSRSVVDEGEVEPPLAGPTQMGSCKIVSSDCGGGSKSKTGESEGLISKIDKERIKEALRKRKYEKAVAANKKARTSLDDDESWIVEELENGIEIGNENKRQRVCTD